VKSALVMIFGLVAENNCHVGIFDFDIWKKNVSSYKIFYYQN